MLLALIWQFDFSPFMVLVIAILNDGMCAFLLFLYEFSSVWGSHWVLWCILWPRNHGSGQPFRHYLVSASKFHHFIRCVNGVVKWVIAISCSCGTGTIMTIAKDRVKPSPLPDSWKLREIFSIGVVLGTYMALMTVLFFWIMHETTFFPVQDLISMHHNLNVGDWWLVRCRILTPKVSSQMSKMWLM